MDNERLDKLGKLIHEATQESLDADFDRRFWAKFETAKEAPLRKGIPFFETVKNWTFLPATALALIGIVVLWGAFHAPTVEISHGRTLLLGPSGVVSVLAPSQKPSPGETLATGTSDWLVLKLNKGCRIKIQPDTELQILRLRSLIRGGTPSFRLVRGAVCVSIDKALKGRFPVEVLTPNLFARAKGTQFIVTSNQEENESSVHVLRGIVESGPLYGNVKPAGTTLLLQGGFWISAKGEAFPAKAQSIPLMKMRELEELFQFGRDNKVILLIGLGPDRILELLKPCALYMKYTASDGRLERIEEAVRHIQEASRQGNRGDHLAAAKDLEKSILGQDVLDQAPLLLFAGAYYHYAHADTEALRVFERVASDFPESSLKSLALLAAAKICVENLGRPQKAAAFAMEIIERYPFSPEYRKAKTILKEVEGIAPPPIAGAPQ